MTELLIDGEPTEDEEMVEFVNASSEPINLDGVAILAERSGRFGRKVIFGPACMPSETTVAVYSELNRWLLFQGCLIQSLLIRKSFRLLIIVHFMVLESAQGTTLDQVSGGESMIQKGQSLTRSRLDLAAPWLPHMDVGQGRPHSPGLCPDGGRYSDGCLAPKVSDCPLTNPGDIVINEVMIDAESDRIGEFVEIINLKSTPRRLSGLELHSNRGNTLVPRVIFRSGCLPPMEAVTMYPRLEDWLWAPHLADSIRLEQFRFGFANNADFNFQLMRSDGEVIDQFAGSRRLIDEGISINRNPDGKGRHLSQHSELHGLTSSPSFSRRAAL